MSQHPRIRVWALCLAGAVLFSIWQPSLSSEEEPQRIHCGNAIPKDYLAEYLSMQGIDLRPEGLLTALKEHPAYLVRLSAAAKLKSFVDDKKAVAALLESARKDSHWEVRLMAIQVLDQLGNPQALNILRQDFEKATDRKQRLEQANLLAKLGDPSGFKAFEEAIAAHAEEEMVIHQIWPFLLFAETRDRAKERIESAFASKSSETRGDAGQAIWSLLAHSPQELDNWRRQLENLKNDPVPEVRGVAESALSFGPGSGDRLR